METLKEDLTKEEREIFENTTIYNIMKSMLAEYYKPGMKGKAEEQFACMIEHAAATHGMQAEFDRGTELLEKPKKTLADVIEIELLTFKLLMTDAIHGLRTLEGRTSEQLEGTEKEMRKIIAETEQLLEDIKQKDDGSAI